MGVDSPSAQQDFAHWPVPIGRVETRHRTTYIHSADPGGFTIDEFRRIPDDRVELLDGVVVVRPDLTPAHRQVMAGLYEDLCDTCPKHLIPFNGRLDLRVGPATVFRPDIQVLSRDEDDAPRVLVADALRNHDKWYSRFELDTRRDGYRSAAVASYWAVDPVSSTVTVYEIKYLKRGSFGSDVICARGQWNHWGLWSKSA